MKEIVLEVCNIRCPKSKTKVLKAASSLIGIDKLTVDAEKGTLTVIGDVDPVLLVTHLRKTGKEVHIISVGPPPKSEKPPEDKPKPKPKAKPQPPPPPPPPCCNKCQPPPPPPPPPCCNKCQPPPVACLYEDRNPVCPIQ